MKMIDQSRKYFFFLHSFQQHLNANLLKSSAYKLRPNPNSSRIIKMYLMKCLIEVISWTVLYKKEVYQSLIHNIHIMNNQHTLIEIQYDEMPYFLWPLFNGLFENLTVSTSYCQSSYRITRSLKPYTFSLCLLFIHHPSFLFFSFLLFWPIYIFPSLLNDF